MDVIKPFLDWAQGNQLVVIFAASIIFLLVSILSYLVAKRIVLRALHFVAKRTSSKWDDIIVAEGAFVPIAHLAPVLVAYYSAYLLGEAAEGTVQRLLMAVLVVISLVVLGRFLNAANRIYSQSSRAEELPIKGYIQIVKLLAYLTGGVIIFSTVLDRSPWGLLSGLGAMTAVLLLVFKDTILSFVASIQLASNDMVRIGDWIEMPQFGADGDVVDIALHTMKVQNWDKTITTIPTHKLIEFPFKNWRGMTDAKGRRIKRSIVIDQASVKFLDENKIQELAKLHHLTDYIASRREEVTAYNRERKIDVSMPANGRRLTNVGTFRAYLENYLRSLPKTHEGMTFLVRQLAPGPNGLPIEIYMFSNDIVWDRYEAFQADIFDHILAALSTFGLRVFQNPTGHDFSGIAVGR